VPEPVASEQVPVVLVLVPVVLVLVLVLVLEVLDRRDLGHRGQGRRDLEV
jgi:hypothetical protein